MRLMVIVTALTMAAVASLILYQPGKPFAKKWDIPPYCLLR